MFSVGKLACNFFAANDFALGIFVSGIFIIAKKNRPPLICKQLNV